MMTIKSMWFYAALAAAVCGGAGVGYAVAPSQGDFERMARQLEQTQPVDASNCEKVKAFKKGQYTNSLGKEY